MAVKTLPEQDALRSAVRDAGLRATPPRLAVLALLQDSTTPLSHGEVVGRPASRGWDPATLYRNLNDLVDAKLARRARSWRSHVARRDRA